MCDRLATWAEKWQLRIAFDKCSVHRISNCDSANVTVCSPKYKIGAHVLHWSDETRDFGVIIDKKLNFNSHVSAVAHKAHVQASLILRTFQTILATTDISNYRPISLTCVCCRVMERIINLELINYLLWSPYVIGQTIIFSSCFFFLSFFFFFFFFFLA